MAYVCLWGLVGLGPAIGAIALAQSATTASNPVPLVADGSADHGKPVAAAAELFVAGYFHGETIEVAGAASPSDRIGISGRGPAMRISRTLVSDSRYVAEGYWAVTVAAEVPGPDGQPPLIRFYEVGVVDSGDGLAIVGGPALVPSPSQGSVPRLAGPSLRAAPLGDPLVMALEQFLSALLAGDGDVDRYLTPGTAMQPVSPAPFATVSVERIAVRGDGAARTALVEVAGAFPDGDEQLLQYEIALVEREGRWEVASISGAPELAPAASSSLDGPGTSVSSPSSSSVPADSLLRPGPTTSTIPF